MLHCAFSQSHSLYLTLPTPNRCPGAHLSALPEQRVETRVWSRVRECRVFHFGQVGEAVARLREMCVGMATVGLRHRGGGWWGGAQSDSRQAEWRPSFRSTFSKIIARIICHFFWGTGQHTFQTSFIIAGSLLVINSVYATEKTL